MDDQHVPPPEDPPRPGDIWGPRYPGKGPEDTLRNTLVLEVRQDPLLGPKVMTEFAHGVSRSSGKVLPGGQMWHGVAMFVRHWRLIWRPGVVVVYRAR